jgi:sortase B
MIKYVKVNLYNNSVIFYESNEDSDFSSILNKNVLLYNKYFYDYNYFKKNIYKIIKVINDEIKARNIDTLIIKNIFILDILLNSLNNLNLPNLEIMINESLNKDDYERIVNYKYLKKLTCYYIPPIYRKKLMNRNIEYHILYKNFISDGFIINNDCFDHDTLYYKKNIVLKDDSEVSLVDLDEFLKLNHNLKIIHLYKYSNEFILEVIKMLEKWNEYNVIIYIYQNYDFEGYLKSNINTLRKINKEYYKKMHGELKIMYSKKYVFDNLFRQLSYNNFKIIMIIICYVAFVAIFFNEFNSYISTNNINELSNIINIPQEETLEEIEEVQKDKYDFEQIFSKLLEINDETVGWLTVNNTKINYPVVKHSDNDYYLHRDFYKTKTSSGWVFMDYRNKIDELNTNTIIFGHRLKNDTIFGSLDLVLNSAWYTNPDNQFIIFNTIYENMEWQVFSIYRVDYTTDYLKVNFTDKNEFDEFIDLIFKRSVYKSEVSVEYGDKILTLSTCIGDNNRLVLHAKLIK